MPLRPPSLLSPVHPSWGVGGDRLAALASGHTAPPELGATRKASFSLTAEQAAKRLRGSDPIRDRAIATFASFLAATSGYSTFAGRLLARGEAISADSVSLIAALEAKKVATLQKRSGTLRLYHAWFVTSVHKGGCPFTEEAVFSYLHYLVAERAAATRGVSFTQMVNFMGGVFGYNFRDASSSSRVRGLLASTRHRLC